jgi:hypothetical protein
MGALILAGSIIDIADTGLLCLAKRRRESPLSLRKRACRLWKPLQEWQLSDAHSSLPVKRSGPPADRA